MVLIEKIKRDDIGEDSLDPNFKVRSLRREREYSESSVNGSRSLKP